MILANVKRGLDSDGTTHYIATDALLVNRKRLHRKLHPVKAGGFPDKVGGKFMCALRRDVIRATQLQRNLIGDIYSSVKNGVDLGERHAHC